MFRYYHFIVKLVQLTTAFFLLLLINAGCVPPHPGYNYDILPRSGRGSVVSIAKKYIGVPYRYAGTTPRGFDCSGYVMYVYRECGFHLPRSLPAQFRMGRRIPKRSLRAGDLVFFKTDTGKWLSHVGIYIGRGKFLHAPSTGKRVSYASLKNPYWRKHYRACVTYFR